MKFFFLAAILRLQSEPTLFYTHIYNMLINLVSKLLGDESLKVKKMGKDLYRMGILAARKQDKSQKGYDNMYSSSIGAGATVGPLPSVPE